MGQALYEDSAVAEPAAESWGHGSFWNSSASRSVHFEVLGLPISQGSMRAFVVKGKPVITSASKNLNQWRQLVALRANEVAGEPFDGPVVVELNFRLPKPKSAPKKKRIFATKRPDLDKLIRSVFDALTHVLFRDDSQVVQITAMKDYGPPGVTVTVTEIVR